MINRQTAHGLRGSGRGVCRWQYCRQIGLGLLLQTRFEFHAGHYEQDEREAGQAIAQLHARYSARQFKQIFTVLSQAQNPAGNHEECQTQLVGPLTLLMQS